MYEASEKETYISTSDVDNEWVIYTRQKKMIAKLIRLGYEAVHVEMEDDKIVGAEFHVNLNKITIKKAITNKRTYTDEERAAIAERLAKGRK